MQGMTRAPRSGGRRRLSADCWTRAALEALVEEGPHAIRVASLARRLGVTTGSFYWHFSSRDQLRDAMLGLWLHAIGDAASAAERAGPGPAKTRSLPAILAERRLPAVDEAIRDWARQDAEVAAQVENADAARIRWSAAMLRAAGLDEQTVSRRAPLLLWAHIGSIGFKPEQRTAALVELTRMLIAPPAAKRRPRSKTSGGTRGAGTKSRS
jgi:AcrR family transcriptional regulator